MKVLLSSVLFGVLGLVLAPVSVFALVLGLGYTFDPRCGTPGDSGGCEMGAATFAVGSALPGVIAGAAIGFVLGLRRTPH
ncbi:hypothetical protein M8R20_05090 [Pseudomonas sp. R2.Fl]|nr:hypothetical protein [Pseudomonas sp. R2.Fl]